MSHFEMAECPVCGKTAYGRNELKKNLATDTVELRRSLGVKNAEVWVVAADTRSVRIGERTILDATIL